jgi:Ser-tRNA(Ala) deacylase AlaX
MTNIFNTQPMLMTHETTIRQVGMTDEGRVAVVVAENIVRPPGGGQPRDYAMLTSEFGEVPISNAFKRDGDTWLELDGPLSRTPDVGTTITLSVDVDRRFQLSRCHSLTHLGMATAKRFVAGYESKGAEISEDATLATLIFRAQDIPDRKVVRDMNAYMRSTIYAAKPIRVGRAKSLADAERTFPEWRIDPDNQLTGRIRVIHIDGVDANACSGSHVANTADIGPFEWLDCRRDGRGLAVMRLRRTNVWMNWYE